jgi:ABC-type multidrug transport system permease subunit
VRRQPVLALATKDMKRLIRDPATGFLIILFPLLLTVAFGTSFGAIGGSQSATYRLGVVNLDSGVDSPWAEHLAGNLTATQILQLTPYSRNETAQSDLLQGTIHAVLLIPPDFGASCAAFWAAPSDPHRWINTTLLLYLDSGSLFATQAIPPLVQHALATAVDPSPSPSSATPIQLGTPSLVHSSALTLFDQMAPGIFAYAAIFITMTVAQAFTTDRETGMLRRLRTTPTTATEIMLSQTISNMGIALLQVALVFAMAHLIGYRPKGDGWSLVMAVLIVALFSLCNVGFGLITATLAKSSGAATGLSFVFIMPQMFLGTFVGFALSPTAQAAGRFVPSYYVTDALTSLFLRGAPSWSPTVLMDLAAVAACSVTTWVIGVRLFQKYGNT